MQVLKKRVDNIKGGAGDTPTPKTLTRPDVGDALKEADRLEREEHERLRADAARRRREKAAAEKRASECCGCGC